MKLAVAIITAARPMSTLGESLHSFREAGFLESVLISSDTEKLRVQLSVLEMTIYNSPPLGNLRNWLSALSSLVSSTEADWLMVCEDDILWAKGSRDALAHELDTLPELQGPRVGGLSLYLPRRHTQDIEHRSGRLSAGWHHQGLQRGRKAWGFQCTLYSRSQAERLLTSPVIKLYLRDPKHDKNVDGIVQEAINNAGQVMLYRVPCMVSHTLGAGNSSLGYKPDRPMLETNYFTGMAGFAA